MCVPSHAAFRPGSARGTGMRARVAANSVASGVGSSEPAVRTGSDSVRSAPPGTQTSLQTSQSARTAKRAVVPGTAEVGTRTDTGSSTSPSYP